MVGGLRYLVHTRPDIAFSLGVVSCFMERPTILDLNAAKCILRYITGTLEYGLIYAKGTVEVMMEDEIVANTKPNSLQFFLDFSGVVFNMFDTRIALAGFSCKEDDNFGFLCSPPITVKRIGFTACLHQKLLNEHTSEALDDRLVQVPKDTDGEILINPRNRFLGVLD
ncbi:uncharacterized protein LOC141702157 [Apium graveolens]|uniref:uncharacterized protein LOC141702157 n=1 Tax=Apium graveolens TaxID=4045 RepID=UPI003D792D71